MRSLVTVLLPRCERKVMQLVGSDDPSDGPERVDVPSKGLVERDRRPGPQPAVRKADERHPRRTQKAEEGHRCAVGDPEATIDGRVLPISSDLRWWANVILSIMLGLALHSCGPDPRTPRGVAQRFLDAYFGLDLVTALEISTHRAHELIEEERQLTAGQTVDAATRVPAIRYWLQREDAGSDGMVHLIYTVRIAPDGAEQTEQQWLVTVGRAGESWTVVNFSRVAG